MAQSLSDDELPPALRVDEILEQVSKDDQEEWEYEYSTTETETYYLTVDLSHPDFKEKREKIANYSRGGYYKAKPVAAYEIEDADKPPARMSQHQKANDGDDEDNEDNEDMREADDADDVETRVRKDKGKDVDRSSPPRDADDADAQTHESLEDIQILDLHSPHPLFSYRGRIFEGDWAEMIGTELILTQRDPEDATSAPLPALRNLNEGIDLLAASASKILTREKAIKPRVGAEQRERMQALKEVRDEWNIHIPLAKRDRDSEKGDQARFLENLMALKKKKGEKDNVTVYARPAGEERKDSTAATSSARRPRGGEDTARDRRPARRRARRTGPRWTRAGMGDRGDARADGGEQSAADGQASLPLSTPTPLRWDDLKTPTSEAAERQRRQGDGNEDQDGDVKMSG